MSVGGTVSAAMCDCNCHKVPDDGFDCQCCPPRDCHECKLLKARVARLEVIVNAFRHWERGRLYTQDLQREQASRLDQIYALIANLDNTPIADVARKHGHV